MKHLRAIVALLAASTPNGMAWAYSAPPVANQLAANPGSGVQVPITESAVPQNLPGAPSIPGDVLIYDTYNPALDFRQQPPSDLLRFFVGTTQAQFFSDNLDGSDSAADVGIPTDFGLNAPVLIFLGEPGWYIPGANDPGFLSFAQANYNIQSDAPEPEPASLGLLGLASLALFRRRR